MEPGRSTGGVEKCCQSRRDAFKLRSEFKAAGELAAGLLSESGHKKTDSAKSVSWVPVATESPARVRCSM